VSGLRIVFMGTPDFAVPTLSALVGHGYEVVACYTREPAPAGRGMALKPSPVHEAALRFSIPVITPQSLKTEEAAALFATHQADVAVVVAYGMILPKIILDTPSLGCLNLHASLLPRWRGAAPIQRAIMAGDAETGVAVMKMAEGLDTGPVAMVEKLPIPREMTAGEAHDRLAYLGADLMVRALAALSRGGLSFVEQAEDGVLYAKKLTNDECRIDWTKPASVLHNQIRGLSPFPGAFTLADFGKGPERLKILRAECIEASASPGTVIDDRLAIACGEGALRLLELQKAGSKPMSSETFLRGAVLPRGTVIG
jgi:methionyl-tRNA formyltransferase